MDACKISEHDQAVLNCIFNPGTPFEVKEQREETETDSSVPPLEELREDEEMTKQRGEAIQLADAGDLTSALDIFNGMVLRWPGAPAVFNDRAQVLQLLGDKKGALTDLEVAVQLSGACSLDETSLERCDEAVAQEAVQLLRRAPVRRRVAKQSLTQLGVLLRCEEADSRALRCFKVAAALGGAFAKEMVVALNPYAALCGSMLSEAIGRLQRGEPDMS